MCILTLLLCSRKLLPKLGGLGKADAAVVRGIVLSCCFPELPGAHPWTGINQWGEKGHAAAIPPGWYFPCGSPNKLGTGGWGVAQAVIFCTCRLSEEREGAGRHCMSYVPGCPRSFLPPSCQLQSKSGQDQPISWDWDGLG